MYDLEKLTKIVEDCDKKQSKLNQADRDAFYKTTDWTSKRLVAIRRDNKECQACKARGRVSTGRLVVHHIKTLEAYPELALDLDNLITLCHSCHEMVHGRGHATRSKKEDLFPEWW